MKKQFYPSVAIVFMCAFVASGCTWVDPKAGASAVTLVKPSHVVTCKLLGTTVSRTTDKVGFINRSDDKVTEELITLAKNAAVELGGDTLVKEGAPSEGSQKFRIYKCQ